MGTSTETPMSYRAGWNGAGQGALAGMVRGQAAVLKKVLRALSWVLGALAILSAVGLYLARTVPHWPAALFWLALALGVGPVVAGAVGVGKAHQWVDDGLPSRILDALMRGLATRLDHADFKSFQLRCNVMRLDGGYLQIVAVPPGQGAPSIEERRLRWAANESKWEGACGRAVYSRQMVTLDIADWRGKPYEAILKTEDGQPRWGITREQWAHTRDIGSVLSIPLFEEDRLVGVMNIDARAALDEWYPNDVVARESLLKWMNSTGDAMAILVESLATHD